MKDILIIKGLAIETTLGVHNWEKKIKRKIKLDLEITIDVRKIASTDDIKLAVDYYALNQEITQFLEKNSFQLIETLAERVAEFILKSFLVQSLRLAVYKPHAIPAAEDVGVIIERSHSSE